MCHRLSLARTIKVDVHVRFHNTLLHFVSPEWQTKTHWTQSMFPDWKTHYKNAQQNALQKRTAKSHFKIALRYRIAKSHC